MLLLLRFSPLLVFIVLYLGISLYFVLSGNSQAFYQFSPLKAIIPAIIIGILLPPFSIKKNLKIFVKGLMNQDILIMSGIFLLSGIFCALAKHIHSIDTLVQATTQLLPSHCLLIGIFLISALISTAIGTSMGVVALIVPLAVHLADQGAFPLSVGVATVIGGAMFGDNLSFVSDTTIAAVLSQRADFKKKFMLNALIAGCAGITMIVLLSYFPTQPIIVNWQPIDLVNLLPYGLLLMLALMGIPVFTVLIMGIISALAIGFVHHQLPGSLLMTSCIEGANTMQEIIVLSLCIGGIGKLLQQQGAMEQLLIKMTDFIERNHQQQRAEGVISFTVSVMDILLANNTIAIILSGDLARNLAIKYHISPHRSAMLLGNFSCVFQGILPYGAQILLASKLSKVMALDLACQGYYCFLLGFFTIGYVFFIKNKNDY